MEKYYITEEAFEKIFMYLRSLKGVYCKKREKNKEILRGRVICHEDRSTMDGAPKVLWELQKHT